MKIAVIRTGGKQYVVAAGQKLKVEKLEVADGDSVKLETLLTADTESGDTQLGTPVMKELVEAKIEKQGRSKKITVVKYKAKTRYARTKGHRQHFTQLSISKI